MILALQAQHQGNLDSQFKTLTESLCLVFENAGIKVRPYLPGAPLFRALTIEKKSEILQHLNFYADLCKAQLMEGKSLRDSQTFTWRALKACGLTPGCDFLGKISAGDVVEIYGSNNNQIFRNLEFFEFCSYTLEELYSCEWWRLFERNSLVTSNLINIAAGLFAGEYPHGVHFPVLPHVVKELSSSENFEWIMDVKFVGPLCAKKSVKAIICIEQISPTTNESSKSYV